MKSLILLITALFIASISSAQIEWAATYNDTFESIGETHAFGMCETPSGVRQLRIYKNETKWYVDIMQIVSGNKLTTNKTSELTYTAPDWKIQSDFQLVGIYNVCHNLIAKNKLAFELIFEDPNPEPNHAQYWCYLYDEEGTLLNITWGIQGQIIGDYIIHETCQPYDITQRIWHISKIGSKTSTSAKAVDFPNLLVFPNPSSKQLNLSQSGEVIQIYNLNGQLIEQLPPHTNTINISNYTKGQYLIKVDNTTLKFIKE